MRRLAPDEAGIAAAAALLRAGALVAFGTETVYGLGALATDARAVAAVFAAKGRPAGNPLICHVPDAEAAFRIGRATRDARLLAARFWPGPLTLVLPCDAPEAVVPAARAGGDTVALRVPASAAVRRLLRAVGAPVAAPSANRSGRVSPTVAADVLAELGDRVAAVLDTGPATVGLESTVVDCAGPDREKGTGGMDTAPALLRPGGVTRAEIEQALGRRLAEPAAEDGRARALRSPGLLRSHYAPLTPVRLDAAEVAPDEALLAFGPRSPAGAAVTVNLSPAGDLREAAFRLFASLRQLDAEACRMGLGRIAVSPVPGDGLGEAIRDRLRRAAAPTGR